MTEFAKYISDRGTTFKYAVGKSSRQGKEFHSFHEILYFMDGDATFVTEKRRFVLKPNTLIVIPKECYHQFVFTREDNYRRCVFNFADNADIGDSLNEVLVLEPTAHTELLFKKMTDISCAELAEQTKFKLMHSVLTLLLYEISTSKRAEISVKKFSSITSDALKFIESHIKESLSVKIIAERLNVSESTLAHIFKNEMKIPIYKFIREKKLIFINRLIADGVPATLAAAEYGFNDYSGFFRQYKAMFGVSPSKTVKKN